MNPLHPIKSLLLFILFLTVMAAGTYVAFNRGLINKNTLAEVTSRLNQINPNVNPDINTQSIEDITLSAKEQSQTMIEKSGIILGESKEFIDTQVKSSENTEPLHNKVFEYARYMYCKQVVDDFEKIKN
ncbi:MAG: hypothetical protein ABFQ62_02825 [Patescibacteria group bacterium]